MGRIGSERLVPLLLAVAGAVSLIFLVHPYYHAPVDGSRYILLARSLAAGEGFTYLGQPFTVQMPGFPALLAPVLALFGTDFYAINLFGSLIGLACVLLFFAYCRPRLGVPVSAALAAMVWLSPSFQTLCQTAMADVPGATAALGCLLLERWAGRRPSTGRDLVLGLAIAAAGYVRNANLMLLPAILIARCLRWRAEPGRRPGLLRLTGRRAVVPVAVVLLAVLPWKVRNDRWRSSEPAIHTRAHSHRVAVLHTDVGDPSSPRVPVSDLVRRVPSQMAGLAALVAGRLDPLWGRDEGAGALEVAVGGAALLCLLAVLARRRGAGEIFAVELVGTLAVWYYFQGRYALLIYLFTLAAVADVLLAALRRLPRHRLAEWALACSIGVLAVLDFDPGSVRAAAAAYHQGWRSAADRIRVELPAGGTFAARVGYGFEVFTESPFYSLQWVRERRGLDGILELIAERRLDAVAAPAGDYREMFAELFDRHGGGRCATLGEEWRGYRRGPGGHTDVLWLFRLDGPVTGKLPPCDPALLESRPGRRAERGGRPG